MTDDRYHRLSHPPWLIARTYLIWLIPLLLYALLIMPATYIRRAQINPDAIVYIRLSTYLLRGDLAHAFSGYWSPLFPWCMTPLLATGMDGLIAAHVLLAVIGAGYVLMAYRLLRAVAGIAPGVQFWIMIVAALTAARMAVKIVSPDLLMAALLMAYLSVVHHADVLRRPGRALLAGFLGSLAYLAKAYALPFFLVHFPITLFIHSWRERGKNSVTSGPPVSSNLKTTHLPVTILAGIGGFLFLAGPWIALLSHSYGRLTMATAGSFNHNQVDAAPDEVKYRFTRFVPPDPYLIENEIKDRRATEHWSPFDSRDHLARQLKTIQTNARQILLALASFDGIWLVPLCILATILLSLPRPGIGWEAPWLAITLLIYCSGFTIVYFEPRLIEAALKFPAMLLCVMLSVQLATRWSLRLLPIAVITIFAAAALIDLPGAFRPAGRDEILRQAGQAMRDHGLKGPIASNNRGTGMYVAYFSDTKLVSMPPTDSVREFERDCRTSGVRCVVIAKEIGRTGTIENPSAPEIAVRGVGWRRRARVADLRQQIEVYERVDGER